MILPPPPEASAGRWLAGQVRQRRAGYYYTQKTIIERAKSDAEIRDKVEQVQSEFPFYGPRRSHEHLERREGLTVNKKKILRMMRESGLKALIWHRFKVKTTDSRHEFGYARNLLPGLNRGYYRPHFHIQGNPDGLLPPLSLD